MTKSGIQSGYQGHGGAPPSTYFYLQCGAFVVDVKGGQGNQGDKLCLWHRVRCGCVQSSTFRLHSHSSPPLGPTTVTCRSRRRRLRINCGSSFPQARRTTSFLKARPRVGSLTFPVRLCLIQMTGQAQRASGNLSFSYAVSCSVPHTFCRVPGRCCLGHFRCESWRESRAPGTSPVCPPTLMPGLHRTHSDVHIFAVVPGGRSGTGTVTRTRSGSSSTALSARRRRQARCLTSMAASSLRASLSACGMPSRARRPTSSSTSSPLCVQ